jgi:hypothetical protein
MKKRTLFFCMAFFLMIFSGCEYDFVLPEEAPVINEPISFSTQVVPIFSTGDKCTQCHKPGGTSPDLTAANAYSQLASKYVNLGNPEQSTILTIPGSSDHSWKKFTAGESATILAWIKQGGKNN